MDPGQADAANAYAGGRGCAGGGEESWGRALLRRGWALSRKVAIAGVAATAAPVVAPQIIILSVTCVALSVPFAACLASVHAANCLMSALLPPVAPPRPCYSTHDDLGCEESSEQELVDAWVTPHGRDPIAYGCWSKTEEDAVAEHDDGFASSERRRKPRISEEPVPLLASNNEGDSAEGEHASPKSGPELFVPSIEKDKESDTAMEVDSEYITMEAPSPGIVPLPEVPVVSREEDILVRRIEEDAPVPAKESVPELPVSDNDNKTEDGKSTITLTVDNESSKEMPLSGLHATQPSDLALPWSGGDDVMVERYVEGDVSVGKALQGSRFSDTRDKTEQHKTTESVSPNEVSISQSKGVDDNMVVSKIEDDIIVEMAPKEEIGDTKPITGEVIGAQSVHQMPREHATTESAHVHDTFGSNIRGGTMKHTDNKCVEGAGYYAEEGMPNIVSVDDDKDLISSTSRTDVLGISMTTIGSKPDAHKSNETTCVAEDKCVKRESKTMDNDVPTTDIAPKDDQSTRENQVVLEMVLEQAASNIDPITGELVEMDMDIINKESETLPVSDLVAHELQVVTGAGMIDDEMEHIVNDIGDINVVDVEHQSGEGASSVVTVTSVLTMDHGEDRISSRSTPDVSAISDDMTSIKGRPDLGHYHQPTGVEYNYKLMDRVFETKVEEKDIYKEEQLREQLNTLRTITGYRGVPSLTLEGEVADLYMFVGVEPPDSSWGASGLMELNTKLRFLKSIIGVE